MMLTTKGRYAVMAVADLATNSKGAPINLSAIAERQVITLNYLEQIFQKLKNSGIVSAVKGPGGGYLLTIEPKELSVSLVIDAVEEKIKITRCEGDNTSCMPHNIKCQTHYLWEGLDNHIRNYFNNVTIEDIINGSLNKKNKQAK